jgi:hypothetical protein
MWAGYTFGSKNKTLKIEDLIGFGKYYSVIRWSTRRNTKTKDCGDSVTTIA